MLLSHPCRTTYTLIWHPLRYQAVFVTSDVTNNPFFIGYLDGPNVISQGNGRRDIFDALKVYVKVIYCAFVIHF